MRQRRKSVYETYQYASINLDICSWRVLYALFNSCIPASIGMHEGILRQALHRRDDRGLGAMCNTCATLDIMNFEL